nr:hypothetical protein BaRGS_000133 [Batillaria attramentaria]
MIWDDKLAEDAEKWSQYCRYQRPPKHMFDCGSNLAYQRRWVHSWHSIRSNIRHGLNGWAREREYFQYGTDCGSACSYVQMIYSAAYRVGCAMNKCQQLLVSRNRRERHATLFVCFYAPKSTLVGIFPYRSGGTCRECPAGTKCAEDLCVPDTAPAPVRLPETPAPTRRPTVPTDMSADALTDQESYFLTTIHNSFRRQEDCPSLTWDMTLQKWADWIVNCKADYPGPPHAYTNFYRCADHMPVYEVVYGWSKEGRDTNIQLEKGCRTPCEQNGIV